MLTIHILIIWPTLQQFYITSCPHKKIIIIIIKLIYFFYPFIFDLRITQPQEQHKESPRLFFFFFPYISLTRNCSNKRIWFCSDIYKIKMLMGNFLQEFDRSNGYVLFFISLPMVAYLRKLKQRKNDNLWINWK